MNGHGLGLRKSEDTSKRLLLQDMSGAVTVPRVNRKLDLYKPYIPKYDQGAEGACVGFGFSWMMSIMNRRFYDAQWLYTEAQLVDPFHDTPPGSGTTSDAGAQVLISRGHRRIWGGHSMAPRIAEGIAFVRWAHHLNAVDELRTQISKGIPFGLGINWYSNFDQPKWSEANGWVIGEGDLGWLRGGHFICGYGASDDKEMFYLVNSWGMDYPLVKIPYRTVERMIQEDGDAAVITDR